MLEHARFFVDMRIQEVQANKKVSRVSSYPSVDFFSAQRRSEGVNSHVSRMSLCYGGSAEHKR